MQKAEEGLEIQRSNFKEASDWRDEVADKHAYLTQEIVEFQAKIGASEYKDKEIEDYKNKFMELQELFNNGHSVDILAQKRIYDLIYNVRSSENGPEGTEAPIPHSGKGGTGGNDDSHEYVDKDGFGQCLPPRDGGFGPCRDRKSADSPYLKTPGVMSAGNVQGPPTTAAASATVVS